MCAYTRTYTHILASYAHRIAELLYAERARTINRFRFSLSSALGLPLCTNSSWFDKHNINSHRTLSYSHCLNAL